MARVNTITFMTGWGVGEGREEGEGGEGEGGEGERGERGKGEGGGQKEGNDHTIT